MTLQSGWEIRRQFFSERQSKAIFCTKRQKHVKDLGDLLQQVVHVSKQPGLEIYLLDLELRHYNGSVPWGNANEPDREEHAIEKVEKKIEEGLSM